MSFKIDVYIPYIMLQAQEFGWVVHIDEVF